MVQEGTTRNEPRLPSNDVWQNPAFFEPTEPA